MTAPASSSDPASDLALVEGLIAHNLNASFFPEMRRYFTDHSDRHVSSQLIMEVELAIDITARIHAHLDQLLPGLRQIRAAGRIADKHAPRKKHPPHHFMISPPPPPMPPPLSEEFLRDEVPGMFPDEKS